MKVLFVTGVHPLPENYSAGIFLTQRLRALKKQGLNFEVIAPVQTDSLFLSFLKKLFNKKVHRINKKAKLIVNGITFNIIPVKRSLFTLIFRKSIFRKMISKVEEHIDVNSFDIIHGHWIFPHGYLAYKLKEKYKKPLFLTAHGSDIHTHPSNDKFIKNYTLEALASSEVNIFVSDALRKEAHKLGSDKGKNKVISNGLDMRIFNSNDRDKIKEKNGVVGKKVVGFVGRLHNIKRANLLPEFFKNIRDKSEFKVKFIIVGSGPLKNEIIRGVDEYNLDVLFTSNIEHKEVSKYLKMMDVMVLPSKNEGFPNVVLEAKACGCSVVGTNVGGIPEAIGNGGKIVDDNGDLVNSLANSVIDLLEFPIEEKKLSDSVKEYTWESVAKKQIQLYQDVVF